jgi:hypothetical protein
MSLPHIDLKITHPGVEEMSIAIVVQGKSLRPDSELAAWPRSDFFVGAVEQTTLEPPRP